jgi:hypothetical protein
MIPVTLESPYAGNVLTHVVYGRRAMADCLRRNEAPFASHLLYTQFNVLNDMLPEERAKGIRAGFAWGPWAKYIVVYEDYGVSAGMQQGIERYASMGIEIKRRKIGKNALPWSPAKCDKYVYVRGA